MQRAGKDLIGRAAFDQTAKVKDGDAVGGMADHRKVVGDDQEADAPPALEVGHQVQDLALHADIQARRRLIGDDQRGVQGQRARHADPPRLPARQLMGVTLGQLRGQAHLRQQAPRLGLPVDGLAAMDHQRFGDKRGHPHPG